jgi:hypothetical protein
MKKSIEKLNSFKFAEKEITNGSKIKGGIAGYQYLPEELGGGGSDDGLLLQSQAVLNGLQIISNLARDYAITETIKLGFYYITAGPQGPIRQVPINNRPADNTRTIIYYPGGPK